MLKGMAMRPLVLLFILIATSACGCKGSSVGDAGLVCVTDEVCITNPGAPCLEGVTDCATGVEVCVDALDAPDGTTCASGTCVAGECLGPVDDAGVVCVTDEVCITNPGAPCLEGVTDCATGVEVCVDALAAPDGTTCASGTCVVGECLGATDITTDVNLTTDSTSGGTCGDGAQHEVIGLAAPVSATLSADPAAGCLDPGDEVLLINLQGAPGAIDNVGNWELLTIGTVTGSTITFTTAKTHFYGSAVGSDANIGTAASQQRVALIRVPHYGALSIGAGTTLTASGFDGQTGGVIALRASSLIVDGAISAIGIGYRSGRWSQDGSDCDDSLDTESGESISGPAAQTTTRNQGGPGGLGAGTNSSFLGNLPINPSAGHALPGEAGLNPIRPLGEPGAAYGVDDATRLTMGSGAGGNISCAPPGSAAPILVPVGTTTAGGIILLLLGDLTVNATGTITASAGDAGRDVSSSGGYVSIVGSDLDIGIGLVSARGDVAESGSPPTEGMSNASSPGYVVLEATGAITGTSTPPANEL